MLCLCISINIIDRPHGSADINSKPSNSTIFSPTTDFQPSLYPPRPLVPISAPLLFPTTISHPPSTISLHFLFSTTNLTLPLQIPHLARSLPPATTSHPLFPTTTSHPPSTITLHFLFSTTNLTLPLQSPNTTSHPLSPSNHHISLFYFRFSPQRSKLKIFISSCFKNFLNLPPKNIRN